MIGSLVAEVMAAATATAALAGTKSISLAPAQYELRLSAEIAEKLSVEAILSSCAEEVDKSRAEAMLVVYYQPVEGSRSILMRVPHRQNHVPRGFPDTAYASAIRMNLCRES